MAVRLSASRTSRALLPRTFSAFGTHFCYRLSKPKGLVRPEVLGKLKKVIHLVGSRTRDHPVYSIVPQPVRSRVPACIYIYIYIYIYKCPFVRLCTNVTQNGKSPKGVHRWRCYLDTSLLAKPRVFVYPYYIYRLYTSI
jgi:hypothetical protein